jgi:hypothetical protein
VVVGASRGAYILYKGWVGGSTLCCSRSHLEAKEEGEKRKGGRRRRKGEKVEQPWIEEEESLA